MTPNQYYKNHTKEQLELLAQAAGTSFANFQQIALADGAVGKRLAERLAAASGGIMTELEILYPERFEGVSAA
jgi:hypothetical protein